MSDASQIDLSQYEASWNLVLQPEIQRTARATVAFGCQDGRGIVLKVMHAGSDERHCASTLQHYDSHGAVRLLDQFENALLFERICPGTPLTALVVRGDDDRAMQILCGVIRKLHVAGDAFPDFPTVEHWGASLSSYLNGRQHMVLPRGLVERAEKMYGELCSSQQGRVVLHGDLHHDNVLFGDIRGWVAIDPKGVRGEPEYEIGAALRNPTLNTASYADTTIIERRIAIAASELGVDRGRIAGWCFTQAILASIWALEDGEPPPAISRGIAVAYATLPIL